MYIHTIEFCHTDNNWQILWFDRKEKRFHTLVCSLNHKGMAAAWPLASWCVSEKIYLKICVVTCFFCCRSIYVVENWLVTLSMMKSLQVAMAAGIRDPLMIKMFTNLLYQELFMIGKWNSDFISWYNYDNGYIIKCQSNWETDTNYQDSSQWDVSRTCMWFGRWEDITPSWLYHFYCYIDKHND